MGPPKLMDATTEPLEPEDDSDISSLGPDATADLSSDSTSPRPKKTTSVITTVILVIIIVDLAVVPCCCVYCWCRGKKKSVRKSLKKRSGSGEDNSSGSDKAGTKAAPRPSEDVERSRPGSDEAGDVDDMVDGDDGVDPKETAHEHPESTRKGSLILRALARVSAYRGTLFDNLPQTGEQKHSNEEDKDSGLMDDDT